MSSPIPPDPYAALGVSKDADISTVRTAHRKLVLKHHPDRISDPALKERGQHLFTEIQQAYELLSDPVRRTRYDDKIKLAELRKEAMMRGDSPRQAYPMRPAPHSASSSREWDTDSQVRYEERRPRDREFDSKERFDPPNRSHARKHSDYERASTAKKPDRSAKAAWGVAAEAVKFGIRVKKEAEKKTAAKSHQSKQETRDREKRQARSEKSRQAYVVDPADSDSDNATYVSHVTASTVRPSKSVPRHHESSSARSSTSYQRRAYTDDDDDSDRGTFVSSMKWEQNHYEGAKEYMAKAAAGTGRPSFSRGDSFWGPQRGASQSKGASDSEKRPTSSRGRRSYDEPPTRPSMPTQNSAPSGLKNRVEERAPGKERRSATGIYPDHRKEMPSMLRSQTMPAPRPTSKKETAPSKSSNLKHAENQDSGYGSSASHTPEMREESPPRRPKMATSKSSSTKYKIVDPTDSDDDRRTQIHVLDDERRFQRSPERGHKDSDRKRAKERPRMETRSKTTTRDLPTSRPKPPRMDSTKYREEPRSPRDSSRESPSMSRHNSERERNRLYAELPNEDKPYRYKYPSDENMNMRTPHPEPQYARYRDSPDRRSGDYFANVSSSRRPSVQAQG